MICHNSDVLFITIPEKGAIIFQLFIITPACSFHHLLSAIFVSNSLSVACFCAFKASSPAKASCRFFSAISF
jgi:hypothetical protein